jgi:hypothetical protein
LINNSFWDVTSSGLTTSAGGIGMTTAQMQTQANFTSATAANGNVNPNWDFATTWVMYDGHTYPLLSSFMTPLTVTANSGTTTYNGSAYSGANGVTYSVAPNSNLLGTLTYGSSPQPAINVGSYVITPGGLYSNQQGYNIHYASGTLTINQLASVAWTGGSTGNWSNAANWAGGAIPDYANVAAVTIPSGTTVTYDGGVPGATALSTLTSSGNLIMAAGKLGTSGNLSTQGFVQSGGTLNVGGSFTINSSNGGVTLGNIVAGSMNVSSRAGAITQLASTALDVNGAGSFSADNGASGTSEIRYGVKLGNAANNFVGPVSLNGANVSVTDSSGGLILGNTTATGTLIATSRGWEITQAAGTAIDALGASFFTADNGASGAGEIRYGVKLGNAANNFVGAVSFNGANVIVDDAGGGLVFGYTTTTGTLTAVSRGGQITQAAGTTINALGASFFTADNGVSGAGDIRYGINLGNAANNFVGAVSLYGANINVNDASGGLVLGYTTAGGTLTAVSRGGQITQAAGTAINAYGASSFTADNGASGAGEIRYGVKLGNTGNNFGGAVSLNGANININDANGGLIFGNTTATGTLTAVSRGGQITQAAGTAIKANQASSFTADNGAGGASDVQYRIILANAANTFGGAVSAGGSSITLNSASPLTANVNSTQSVALTSAGKLAVSGTIHDNLTTVTTGGTGSTTTFGTTTVGANLNVTSPGVVTTVTPSTPLTVHGAGTHTPNPHVTVNHVVGALID